MRALPLLLLILLPLLGCTAAPSASRQANCEALVDSDPEIRSLEAKQAGSTSPKQSAIFDPVPLRQVKMKACLHGYPVSGGVEPVRHPNFTFDLF